MAQAPRAPPTAQQIAAAQQRANPTQPPWINEHMDKFTDLSEAVEDAKYLLGNMDTLRRLRVWPGLYQRKKGKDGNEDTEDVTVKEAGPGGPGLHPESDAETVTDSESDTKEAMEDLARDDWAEFWIPTWSHPQHRDVRRVKLNDNDAEQRPYGFRKRIRVRLDIPELLNRPALLPKDAAKKPTLYAKRYGIDPDNPSTVHGRSRFSPSASATRRIQVEHPVTGQRTGIRVDHRLIVAESQKLSGGMAELLAKLDTIQPQDPKYAGYMAIKKFLTLNADDQDYQRAVFYDLSTDERINLKTADPADPNPPPDSDLRGELNPGVDYSHWWNRLKWKDPSDVNGFTVVKYKLEGMQGDYGARTKDQRAWMAIQPALQLASRILEAHPIWAILCDPLRRRLVPEERLRERYIRIKDPNNQRPEDPRGYRKRRKLSKEWPIYIHMNEGDGIPMPQPEAWSQLEKWEEETAGIFDIGERVWDYLHQRVEYQLGLSISDANVTDKPGGDGTTFGLTGASKTTKPLISLSVGGVWPLLVPSFTLAEKGIASKYLATTLLHEIAHAADVAARALVSDHWLQKEPNLTHRAREAMRRLRWELMVPLAGKAPEPILGLFDARSELGYALEKTLWTGIPGCASIGSLAIEGYPDMEWMGMVAPCLRDWPDPLWPNDPNKHAPDDESKYYLLAPRLPIHKYQRLTTTTEETKLFQQSFWDKEVAKRGTTALYPTTPDGGPLPTVRATIDAPKSVFKQLFTEPVLDCILDAMGRISSAGYLFAFLFLKEWLNEIGEGHVVLGQWWHFCNPDAEWNVFIDKLVVPYTKRMRLALKVLTVDLQHNAHPDAHKLAAMQAALQGSTDTEFKPPGGDIRDYSQLVISACTQAGSAVRQTGPYILNMCVVHLSEIQVLIMHHLALRRPMRDQVRAQMANSLAQKVGRFSQAIRELVQIYSAVFSTIEGILSLPNRGPQLNTDAQYRKVVDLGPPLATRLSMAVNGVQHAFHTVFMHSYTQAEGISAGQQFDSFISIPNRRFRRRKQAVKKQAMREVYKMPKRIRDVFWNMVKVLGHVAKKVHQATINPEIDIEDELLVNLERAKKRMNFPRPLEGPTISRERFFDISSDMKRKEPPDPISKNLIPARPGKRLPGGDLKQGSQGPSKQQQQPDPFALQQGPLQKLLPDDVSREWILNLFGGQEVLAQMENPNHPHPWTYMDNTDAKKRHDAMRYGRTWTPVPSDESDYPDSIVSDTPPESDYQSTDSDDDDDDDDDSDSSNGSGGAGPSGHKPKRGTGAGTGPGIAPGPSTSTPGGSGSGTGNTSGKVVDQDGDVDMD